MRRLVAVSGLSAIMPESSVEETPHVRVLPLVDPEPVRTSALLWPRHKFRTLAAKRFAEIVRDQFASPMPQFHAAGRANGMTPFDRSRSPPKELEIGA